MNCLILWNSCLIKSFCILQNIDDELTFHLFTKYQNYELQLARNRFEMLFLYLLLLIEADQIYLLFTSFWLFAFIPISAEELWRKIAYLFIIFISFFFFWISLFWLLVAVEHSQWNITRVDISKWYFSSPSSYNKA